MTPVRSRVLWFGVLIVWADSLSACGKVSAGNDAGAGADASKDGDAGAEDVEPAVLSITPDDGATGVAPDAEIVVVFNVAMDQASVEAGWTSSELPFSDVTFSWNSAGDTFTATPADEMPIAEADGLDPGGVDPITVRFGVQDATDLEGNVLAPFASEFTTQRRLRVELSSVEDLTNSVFNDGTPVDPPSISTGAGVSTDFFWRLLVTFALPDPPEGASLEQALLTGEQEEVDGTPYQTLGQLHVLHVTFTSLGLNAFQGTPLASPGVIFTDATLGAGSIDVTAQVEDDIANSADRNGRSQYRLQFATATKNDGNTHNAIFGSTSAAEYRSTFKLNLAFLID